MPVVDSVALLCTAALGLLLFVLGLSVSMLRFRARVPSGCSPEPNDRLTRLVRAHGNTAEYVPFLALLFLYLGSRNPPMWQLGLMVVATASRFLLVAGLVGWPTMAKPNPARFVGALGTYAAGAALCIALLGAA